MVDCASHRTQNCVFVFCQIWFFEILINLLDTNSCYSRLYSFLVKTDDEPCEEIVENAVREVIERVVDEVARREEGDAEHEKIVAANSRAGNSEEVPKLEKPTIQSDEKISAEVRETFMDLSSFSPEERRQIEADQKR